MSTSRLAAAGAEKASKEDLFVTDQLTGGIDYLKQPNGRASSLGITPKKPRILKRFVDLSNVTITPQSGSIVLVSSIDQNSPFGEPALKVTATVSSSAQYMYLDLINQNIPLFDGHVAWDVWLDEPHRIASMSAWVGTASSFAKSTYWQTNFFGGGQQIGGHRVVWGGPLSGAAKTDNGGGFAMGSDTLVGARLKVTIYPGAVTTLWFKRAFIPAKQRPIVCFTFDDASVTWATLAAPLLLTNNIRATFGVETDVVGTNHGLYCDSTDILALKAAGHQIACHNVHNYAMQMLYANNTGETNGSGPPTPPQDSVLYAADYNTARQTLEGYGIDYGDFCYHPWVQGKTHEQGRALLQAAGVEIARLAGIESSRPGGGNVYGFPMGNNAMALVGSPLAASSASVPTLAQNLALIDDAVKYGGLVIFYGHIIAAASGTDTIATADLSSILAYAAANDVDILTMHELRDRFYALGALTTPSTNPSPPVRLIGRLYAADMTSSGDQLITLPLGSWIVTQVYAAKGSVSMTTAVGGVYVGAGTGGTQIVANSQAYSGLTGASTDVVTCTMNATPTVAGGTDVLNFCLTTPQASGTADVFVYGRPA